MHFLAERGEERGPGGQGRLSDLGVLGYTFSFPFFSSDAYSDSCIPRHETNYDASLTTPSLLRAVIYVD